MTHNFTDRPRADYITKKIEEVAKAMNCAMVSKPAPWDYNIVPYQTTHNTGGTITGKSPEDSVVNSTATLGRRRTCLWWVRAISRTTAAVIPRARWAPWDTAAPRAS